MPNRHLSAVISIILLLSLLSCNNVRRHNTLLLDDVELLMDSVPDRALALLDSIDTDNLVGEEQPRYAVLFTRALFKNYIYDLLNDSLINTGLDYYRHHDNPRYLMLATYCKSGILLENNDYSNAMKGYLQAADIATEINDFYYLVLIYQNIAIIQAQTLNFPEYYRYALLTREAAERAGRRRNINFANLDVALALSGMGKYKSCDSIIIPLVETAKGQSDTLLWGESLSGLSFSRYCQGRYDDAKKIIQYKMDSLPAMMRSIDYTRYSNILAALGQWDSIPPILRRYEEELTDVGPEENVRYYTAMYNYLAGIKEWEKAAEYLSRAVNIEDSLSQIAVNLPAVSAERDYLHDKNLYRDLKYRYLTITALAVSGCIFVILVVTCLHFKSQSRIKTLELNEIIAEAEALRNDISKINNIDPALTRHYTDYLTTIDTLCSQIFETTSTGKTSEHKRLHAAINKIVSAFRDENSYAGFENLVDSNNNHIISRLRTVHPEFKENEIRLYCYLVAGFSTRTISVIQSSSANSVYIQKSRLKSRLRTQGDPDFYDIFN